jgi:hypothetical protein
MVLLQWVSHLSWEVISEEREGQALREIALDGLVSRGYAYHSLGPIWDNN